MVAVSGGVDSVALLHMLKDLPDVKITVAHFDHGIREDSAEDRRLVQALAREYSLPFVYHRAELGRGASEAKAREARYQFLHHVRSASGADAIITAHHQDDLLETAVLNLLRGTGRRGLSSLRSTDVVKRPLLHIRKDELLRFADREGLQWHEDSTNTDVKYLRNHIRHRLLPRFADTEREALLVIIRRAAELNRQIAAEVSNYLHVQPAVAVLDRHNFIMLPHAVAREVMAEWLLAHTGAELSRKMLERLVVAAKTGRTGSKVDVDVQHWLQIDKGKLSLRERKERRTKNTE